MVGVITCRRYHSFKDTYMLTLINRFRQDESGASMVEYVLLVALIAIIAATGALALGQNINNFFKGIAGYLATVPTNP